MMTADVWSEDAQGLWQSQESPVTRMSDQDLRARADRWDLEFRRTAWVPFACAGVLFAFFVVMLVLQQTTLQRVGAAIGITAAAYLAWAGFRMATHPWLDEGATCVRAYKTQLERRRGADLASARTILLAMTGGALLSAPAAWVPWTLQAGSQLAGGIIVYVYVLRQATRFQSRIDELARLERD